MALAIASAEAAWPELKLSRADFSAHVVRSLTQSDCAVKIEDLHVADLYLAFGAASGHENARDHFLAHHWVRLDAALARFGQGRDFSAEVRQRVAERLLLPSASGPARLWGYRGRGPLAAWVATAARKLALELVSRRREASLTEEVVHRLATSAAGPEAELVKKRHRQQIELALSNALKRVAPRERQALFMHLAGASLTDIGRVYGVDKSTVFHWFRKVRMLLKDAILHGIDSELTASELASIVRWVRSQVDLGIEA